MSEQSDNPVYGTARDGLEKLMSPAAAARLLERVLGNAGSSAAAVTGTEMQQLLLGPIFAELRAVLPPAVLEVRLAELARSLQQRTTTPAGSVDGAAAGPAAAVAEPPAVTSGVRTELPQPADPSAAELEKAVLRLAAFDGVRLAVAVNGQGEASFHRGSGDVERLARLGRLALALLSRNGSIRFSLFAFGETVLLFFPWADSAVMLAGTPELNVGAAVAAFKETVLYREDA